MEFFQLQLEAVEDHRHKLQEVQDHHQHLALLAQQEVVTKVKQEVLEEELTDKLLALQET
jgi:hypothetical protein